VTGQEDVTMLHKMMISIAGIGAAVLMAAPGTAKADVRFHAPIVRSVRGFARPAFPYRGPRFAYHGPAFYYGAPVPYPYERCFMTPYGVRCRW
jgi:hypothetical protein